MKANIFLTVTCLENCGVAPEGVDGELITHEPLL